MWHTRNYLIQLILKMIENQNVLPFHQKKKYRSFFGSNSKIKMKSNNFSGKDEQIKQDISGDSGVIKTIIKEGSGSLIQDGFQVKLNYEGKLENGRVFDSSLIKNKPFSFIVGDGKVISGWELGIKSMKIGEKAEFYISSKYGYKNINKSYRNS